MSAQTRCDFLRQRGYFSSAIAISLSATEKYPTGIFTNFSGRWYAGGSRKIALDFGCNPNHVRTFEVTVRCMGHRHTRHGTIRVTRHLSDSDNLTTSAALVEVRVLLSVIPNSARITFSFSPYHCSHFPISFTLSDTQL